MLIPNQPVPDKPDVDCFEADCANNPPEAVEDFEDEENFDCVDCEFDQDRGDAANIINAGPIEIGCVGSGCKVISVECTDSKGSNKAK